MNSARKLFTVVIMLLALCSRVTANPRNILIVMNANSADSVSVAKYYAAKRGIASKYICKINCPTSEVIKDQDCDKDIRIPITNYLLSKGLKDKVDYIVLTRGIPIRTEAHWGVDSLLTCPFHKFDSQQPNPYYESEKHFSHKDFGIYLVTRLDGLTLADAKALVDRSLQAKRQNGPFLLDVSPGWDNSPGYAIVNDGMRRADKILKAKGMDVEFDDTTNFIDRTGLMGYYSWGSNDGKYSQESFNKLRFIPGSIAELAQSTSAYTLTSNRTLQGKRSYITDLVAQGVTGVKGYVYEPYTIALASADTLFDRYTSGFNLAESFYSASRFIHWRDLVLGDPLCAPYAKAGKRK